MFLTTAEAQQALADDLKIPVGSLSDYWTGNISGGGILPGAQQSAYQDIVGALIGRGFSQAQIDAWDRGPEFERDLMLFRAHSRGGGLSTEKPAALDRSKDLLRVEVFIKGVWQQPAAAPNQLPGQVMTGKLKAGDRAVRRAFPHYGRGWNDP
jgi:hypothetical protein